MIKTAVLSECKTYRYRLSREFAPGRTMMMIMVNPSTADDTVDDQTIRKCVGFAERAGFGRLIVGNKFAHRSAEVADLRHVKDPIGPENDHHLREMMSSADTVVVGWGALSKIPEALRSRWKDIVRMADDAGHELQTIGINADKHPTHPQITGYEVPITKWDVPWFANRKPAK